MHYSRHRLTALVSTLRRLRPRQPMTNGLALLTRWSVRQKLNRVNIVQLRRYSPNSITLTFTETSPRGKSWTQITEVADTNHLDMSRCLRQSPGQVHDKVADLSRTQIMKVGDVICVADFHDLCPRPVRDFVANLSRTLSQSRRYGIWAYVRTSKCWHTPAYWSGCFCALFHIHSESYFCIDACSVLVSCRND